MAEEVLARVLGSSDLYAVLGVKPLIGNEEVPPDDRMRAFSVVSGLPLSATRFQSDKKKVQVRFHHYVLDFFSPSSLPVRFSLTKRKVWTAFFFSTLGEIVHRI